MQASCVIGFNLKITVAIQKPILKKKA